MRKRENLKEIRKTKIRVKIKGVSHRPRLTVFRSHKYIYAQLIDDEKGQTLVAASEKELKRESDKENKIERARRVGQLLAEKAQGKKIKTVFFDRGGYKYHGRVKALAEGAREKGLVF